MAKTDVTVTTTEGDVSRGPLSLVVSTAGGVRIVALTGQRLFVVGRDEESDVPIDDPSVSRRHAVISLSPLSVEDLGSRNGTFVGDARLEPRAKTPLALAQVIRFGQAVAFIRPAEEPAEPVADLVLADEAMRELYERLETVAPSDLTVLLLGETGVGKEVVAQKIHERSGRTGPFLQLNCGALPESILEGELFGHEKGAFTGAVATKAGLFEAANEGTLFLDEVGELPTATQTKLLRVLENREVLPLGARKPVRIDVRFVAATHRDLPSMVREGTMRQDLYFRLNGLPLRIPPLRDRQSEILPLAQVFLGRSKRKGLVLSGASEAALLAHPWPGNVRELRNVMDRAAVLVRGTVIEPRDLMLETDVRDETLRNLDDARATIAPMPLTPAGPGDISAMNAALAKNGGVGPGLAEGVREFERQKIVEALAKTNGNKTQAAKLLGISRYALLYRIRELAIASD